MKRGPRTADTMERPTPCEALNGLSRWRPDQRARPKLGAIGARGWLGACAVAGEHQA